MLIKKFSWIHWIAGYTVLLFLGMIMHTHLKNIYEYITQSKNHIDTTQTHTHTHTISESQKLIAISQSLAKENKFEDALSPALKALELFPHDITILLHLGFLYLYLSDLKASLKYHNKAYQIAPENALVLYNCGNVLGYHLGKIDNAIPFLQKAIAVKPNYGKAHKVLGELLLMIGDYEKAWPEFNWAWEQLHLVPGQLNKDLHGKKILLKEMDGFGDTFQFIRYIKLLKERGATIIIRARKSLVPFYSLNPYIDKIIVEHDPTLQYDFFATILALPLLFNTTVETIPTEFPYIKADQKLVQFWKTKLSADKNFKIGLVWHTDQAIELERPQFARKSIPLIALYPLLRMPNISFYSLQKYDGVEELKNVPKEIKIHQFDADFDIKNGSFMDTLAVIDNMDLIISVDTAIAHLAGGLNKPVWLMLTFPAEWRWMLNRSDSPWYPTMKIFRREQDRGWESMVGKMVTELKSLVAK